MVGRETLVPGQEEYLLDQDYLVAEDGFSAHTEVLFHILEVRGVIRYRVSWDRFEW